MKTFKPLSYLFSICASLAFVGCAGGDDASVGLNTLYRGALGTPCATIGIEGNRTLITERLGVSATATISSTKADGTTENKAFGVKGGAGLFADYTLDMPANVEAGASYMKGAMALSLNACDYLAQNKAAVVADDASIFSAVLDRGPTSEEIAYLDEMRAQLSTDIEKSAATCAAVVSSLEAQCL